MIHPGSDLVLDRARAERAGHTIDARIAALRRWAAVLRRVDIAMLALGLVCAAMLLARSRAGALTPWAPLAFVLVAGAVSIAAARIGHAVRRRLASFEHELPLFERLADDLRRGHAATIVVAADRLPDVHALLAAPRPPTALPAIGERARVPMPWMRLVVTMVAVAAPLLRGSADESPTERTWLFLEESDIDALGLESTRPNAGAWRVEPHAGATGQHALVNGRGDVTAGPATAMADAFGAGDVLVRTRCKAEPIVGERGCGVVFRWDSAQDHWVARVDASAGIVALGVVRNGVERLVDSATIAVDESAWQELVVTARGDRIVVEHNGAPRVEARDATSRSTGGIGLWAPAASIAYFDELTVQPLTGRPGDWDDA